MCCEWAKHNIQVNGIGPYIAAAQTGPADDVASIKRETVTSGSGERNIRPVILRDEMRRIVLWNKGLFNTCVDYNLDAAGVVKSSKPPFFLNGFIHGVYIFGNEVFLDLKRLKQY